MRLIVIALMLAIPTIAHAQWVITETQSKPQPKPRPRQAVDGWAITEQVKPILKAVCTSVRKLPEGIRWTYSDGRSLLESWADYSVRLNRFCCTTGHCGTPGPAGTPALGGCKCGCKAGACNCAHSPGIKTAAAKPLKPDFLQLLKRGR